MLKDTDLILVKNRNNGSTGYTLDNNFHREFSYQEEKKVPFEELKRLSYAPGGAYILDNYLIIENEEALNLLNMHTEREYFYEEDQIRDLLFNNDNLDLFADFLDFAPEGAVELAKKIAIEEQVPDVRKRKMLSERTGLNINNAIMINGIMDAEDEAPAESTKQRRVPVESQKTETAEKTPQRRVPQYKVIDADK